MELIELQNLLNTQIPLSKAMDIEFSHQDDLHLLMKLPLIPNKNHKNTLFGGSLYAACALACYGLFMSGLRKQGVHTQDIVIADGQIKYLSPVTKDTLVRADWPSRNEKAEFFVQLAQKGKARITMRATISEGLTQACEFSGRFVAFNDTVNNPDKHNRTAK